MTSHVSMQYFEDLAKESFVQAIVIFRILKINEHTSKMDLLWSAFPPFWRRGDTTMLTTNTLTWRKWAAAWQNQQNDLHPAKTQISLGVRPVWSVFAVSLDEALVLTP